ncbi:hypothetical protein [Paraburkholderia aromaticivorans]|uniref:hypothetical protein n=1 Tax=Paraburkholderia aromaticivorans TaxID=2026199 RepID=UPI001F0E114C|nr:hypothetical protein [Paraburkholderia aromaticivorans]
MAKSMLLPLSPEHLREASLANHLALVACRGEFGTLHLLNELIRVVYLTYYVQQDGFGDAPLELYQRVEAALGRSIAHGERTGKWRLDPADIPYFENILRLRDQQLSSATLRFIVGAEERLCSFLRSRRVSPLPTADAA